MFLRSRCLLELTQLHAFLQEELMQATPLCHMREKEGNHTFILGWSHPASPAWEKAHGEVRSCLAVDHLLNAQDYIENLLLSAETSAVSH